MEHQSKFRNMAFGRRVSLLFPLAIAVFGCREQVDEETLPAGERRAKVLYEHHCSMCHGIDGRGRALPGPPSDGVVVSQNLTTKAFQQDRSDADIERAIHDGVAGTMPPFARVLDESEIDDLVSHVRQLAAAQR